MAEALIAELDQVPTVDSDKIRTIALVNAEANTVRGILSTVLREQMRTNRSLSVDVEPLTNSLIVTGDDETFAMIEEWAQKLDSDAATAIREPVIREILNANPWEIVSVLNQTFMPKGPGRRMQAGKEITFQIIAGNNLVIQAPAEKMDKILAMIDQLDELTAEKLEIRKYELPGIGEKIQQFARQVQDAYNQQLGAQQARERRISISAYPEVDTLVVTALPTQFTDIEAMMEEFKDLFQGETLVTEFLELEYLNAQQVAPQLTRMVANRVQRVQKRGSRSTQDFSIEADPRTNRLIVTAPEKIMPDVKEVLVMLDVEPEEQYEQVRTIELANADGGQVASVINQLFVATANERRRTDQSQLPIRVVYEPITNALLVSAADEDFERIREKAIEIDERSIVQRTDPVLIKIEYADPGQVSQIINQTLGETGLKWGTRRNTQREVNTQVVGQSLLVQAPAEKMQDVKDLIATIDQPESDTTPVVITLANADPRTMQGMIQSMFAGGRGKRTGDIQISAFDDKIVIKAPAKQLETIQEIVATVDADVDDDLEILTFKLDVLNATDIARQVSMALGVMGNRKRGGLQPGAFAEPTTNTLIALVPKDKVAYITALVKGIDIPRDITTPERYELKNARAASIAENVAAMLEAKAAERGGSRGRGEVPISVTPDERTNTLLVYAAQEYHELAAELIAMLDVEKDTGEIIHIIPLETADATELADTLNQIMSGSDGVSFSRRSRWGGRGGSSSAVGEKVNIVADASSNSLILKGLPQDVADVESLIDELEGRGGSIPELKIVTLAHANADDVKDALQTIFPTTRGATDAVTVTVDDYGARLIITASRRKMRLVEGYIEQLDQQPEGSIFGTGNRSMYFLDVYRGDAFDLAWDISAQLPDNGPTVDADWYGEYIKVIATPEERDQIEGLLRQLEARVKEEIKVTMLKPKDIRRIRPYLEAQFPKTTFMEETLIEAPEDTLIIDVWPEGQEPPVKRRKSEKERESASRVDIRPVVLDEETLADLRRMSADEVVAGEAAAGTTAEESARRRRFRHGAQAPPSRSENPPRWPDHHHGDIQ